MVVHSTGDTTVTITSSQYKQSKCVNILNTLHKNVANAEQNNPKYVQAQNCAFL